jgi:hypothetical protein
MSRSVCPSCGSSTGLGTIHCFKCGYLINVYATTPGYFVNQGVRNRVLQLRDDLELNPSRFAPAALAWLYKACIYDEVVKAQMIAYCTEIHKVLIPAFNSANELMFYQLRKLDNNIDGEKYMSYGKMSSYTINYNDHDDNLLLIVEDHLSAIRLRKYFNVCALSGTSLAWGTALGIVNDYTNIVFWLDPDQPGRDAMYKVFNKLKYHSDKHSAKLMFTGGTSEQYNFQRINYNVVKEDPKFYLDNEIKYIVNNEVVCI